jgi:hypothetical protein
MIMPRKRWDLARTIIERWQAMTGRPIKKQTYIHTESLETGLTMADLEAIEEVTRQVYCEHKELMEALEERDQEIAKLKRQLEIIACVATTGKVPPPPDWDEQVPWSQAAEDAKLETRS